MFYSVTGNIIKTFASAVAVECSGVGFKINTSLNTLKKIGGEGNKATLYTYLSVREDALDLFGFYDEDELECFKLLISVSGVGPKAALSILSLLTPESLALAVASGDAKAVTKAQGVGPKIAERVVRELKGKLSSFEFSDNGELSDIAEVSLNPDKSEAVSALQFLGYSQSEASRAVASVKGDFTVEEVIKKALNILSSN
mgnify:FL=1